MSGTDSITTTKRTLKRHTDVVRRLDREMKSYQNEVTELTVEVGKMTEDAADEYDIRNKRKMLAESEKMVGDSQSRLGKAQESLRDLLDRVRKEETGKEGSELLDSDEVKGAMDAIEELNT